MSIGKRSSRLFSVLALVALVAVLMTAPALAKNENVKGKVVIYTSMYEDIIEEVDRIISKEFPNLGSSSSMVEPAPCRLRSQQSSIPANSAATC